MKTPAATEQALFLRPSSCALQVQLSRPWVYALVKSGALRGVKVAGKLRIRRQDWEAWLKQNVKPIEPKPKDAA